MRLVAALGIMLVLSGCDWKIPSRDEGIVVKDSLIVTDTVLAKGDTIPVVDSTVLLVDSTAADNTRNGDTAFLAPSKTIDVKAVRATDVVAFAKTLVGTPYVYGSSNPKVGFDCSGFITYVFNHFRIAVPRSSIDFTNVGITVPIAAARQGDLILYTGTNPAERHVGHMGLIITNAPDSLRFIHSSSGKAHGVTVSPLDGYYQTRFVKVIRIFP
jgi:cell wall-associated NlpC family hydrolase